MPNYKVIEEYIYYHIVTVEADTAKEAIAEVECGQKGRDEYEYVRTQVEELD